MKKVTLVLTLVMGFVVLAGCDVSHDVEHFEAPLGIMNENDEFEVVYRITFPELTEYRYTKHQDVRDLHYYDTHHVGIMSETIDDTDSFEWIDDYFRSRYEVRDTDEHCMHAVEFEDYTLCYRDLRESQSKATVGIYIDLD